jgi:hypothetical protein
LRRRLYAADRSILAPKLDRDAIYQHPVDGAVALDQRRGISLR